MSLLITRPEYDVATRYLSRWSAKVLDTAKKKGVTVFDLSDKKTNKKEFSKRIKKLNPKLVVLNGHGSEDCVTGHDNKALVCLGDNEKLLDSRITYAVSCRSAKKLGKKVGNKNTAYIGYLDDFIFTSSIDKSTKPLLDKRAKPFMESSNHVSISLLKGHSAKDSSDRSKDMFKQNFRKLLSSDSNPNSLQDAQFLWWNMRNQVCYGNGDMKV